MVYGLYALSSVNHSVCHRRPCNAERIVTRLAPDLGAPGPHDFAVRERAPPVSRHLHVHRIPHHVRDDAYAPRVGAEWEELITTSAKTKDIYFCGNGWTTQISLK